MCALLEVKNVTKTYKMGKVLVPALRGVSFDVEEGEFLAILGPSGSGKSTLLHIMGGLDRPTQGEVFIDGINVYKLSDNKLAEIRLNKVGFVFQFFNLLPRLTAFKNVQLSSALADEAEKTSVEKVKKMLKLVGLEERMNHRPTELSGGEQQRVAIARALINSPKIAFADEPTGNLDTKTGWEIIQIMKKLNKESKQTFIIITHDPSIAETANRIIYLKDGLIEGIKAAPRRNK